MHFSDSEVGLYIRLLGVQWTTGGLPDDDKELSRYGRGKTPLARVKAKFLKCEIDGLLRNPRLEKERQKQVEWREKSSNGGRKSAEARAKGGSKGGSDLVATVAQPKGNTPVSGLLFPSPNTNLAPGGAGATSKPKKRERNPLLDALAGCDGSDPMQVTESAWGATAKALKEIREVSPNVTPDEIARRAKNYRAILKDAILTPSALAKNWAKCDWAPGQQARRIEPEIAEPTGWYEWLNGQHAESIYSKGGTQETRRWQDFTRDMKQWITSEMRKAS